MAVRGDSLPGAGYGQNPRQDRQLGGAPQLLGRCGARQDMMSVNCRRDIWLVAILAAGVAANTGCSSYSRETKPKQIPLEPVLGSLDSPVRGGTVRGSMLVGGWAIAESGVKWIAIYIDRQFVVFATVDGRRDDI